MNKFSFYYPTKVYFGEGSTAQALGEQLAKHGKTVMLAYGGGSIKTNGIYNEICTYLNNAGKNIVEFSGIMSNPTYEKVQEGSLIAKENNIDLIIAVGGGSVIDCCKAVSAQALLDENLWEMEYAKGKFPERTIPLGAIVTASGTGAEMNGGAVITNESKNLKAPLFAAAPEFAVLNPVYTLSVPPAQVMSGAFDTLSHAFETYLGKSDDDNVSDELALAVIKNTVANMRRVAADLYDIEARGNLMWDSAMAENGILKCGRATDFQAHQIEHQLGAFTDCNHGQGLAVILPAYYRHILNDAPEKFDRLARIVWSVETREQGLEALQKFIIACNLPTRLNELKTKQEITPDLLRKVADTTNIIKTGPRELSCDEIYTILSECL